MFSTVNLVGKFTRVLGLDVSPAMVAAAARAVAGAEFKVSPAETLPVLSNTAQLVIVGRAIHYFDHKHHDYNDLHRLNNHDGDKYHHHHD